MKTILYSCPFVPEEWISAHGMLPRRILPRRTGMSTFNRAGLCSYARAFVHTACSDSEGDAVVVTTVCDQMRRVSERIARDSGRPVFLMNVPATWQTPGARRLYIDELKRLGRFLEALGGKTPTNDFLAEVMRKSDAKRSSLRDTRVGAACGVPLALVGSPLVDHHLEIFDVIERAGGKVVLDGTESGERTVPAPFDLKALNGDLLCVLTEAYFGSIPDASQRPNTRLYRWMEEEISKRKIRGIILRYYTWCDTWHAEAGRMKEWADIPLIVLVTDADEFIGSQTVSRIDAFVEMLK